MSTELEQAMRSLAEMPDRGRRPTRAERAHDARLATIARAGERDAAHLDEVLDLAAQKIQGVARVGGVAQNGAAALVANEFRLVEQVPGGVGGVSAMTQLTLLAMARVMEDLPNQLR